MATFHSTDRWFTVGIAITVLHFLLLSGWYSLRHVLYSQIWTLASITRIIFAILFMVLHSKRSNSAILLSTSLWNLISLAVLLLASVRTYIHVSSVSRPGQKTILVYLKVVQHFTWIATLFFASAIGCWVRATVKTKKRTYFRRTARVLNWTGGALLILCFVVSTVIALIIVFRSLTKKKIPVPALLVAYGSLMSAPFMIVRLSMQMIWMRHRNTISADFRQYVGGGMVMEFMVSCVNLLVAWYTLGMVRDDTFIRAHSLQDREKKMMLHGMKFREQDTTERATRRTSLVRSAISLVSVSTMASFSRATSIVTDHRTDRAFQSKFVIKATGRHYKMDDGNTLVRSVRRAYKDFHIIPDSTFEQRPYTLNATLAQVTAQRVLGQIARLLWLFTLWETNGDKDASQRQFLETDIKSIWYEDMSDTSDVETAPVHKLRSFNEISGAVLGTEERRPVDKMLKRVFMHFFDRLQDHDVEIRASLCLFALRLMLKQDLFQAQDLQSTFAECTEAAVLDISEDMWHRFDNLAASLACSTRANSNLQQHQDETCKLTVRRSS